MARKRASTSLSLVNTWIMRRGMNSASPGFRSVRLPPTVNVVTPSSSKTVSSKSSWLCGAGMRALAGTSHSKTLTLPPDSSAST